MSEIIKTTFQFRRGLAEAWQKNNPILARGEPGFVIDENRLKIGDGTTAWNDLDYLSEDILRGYYYNGWFYRDESHTKQFQAYMTKFYFDIPTQVFYYFNGDQYKILNDSAKPASETEAGIMKLYQNTGTNEDGSMSQKSITQTVNNIKLNIDSHDLECLVLDLP